MDPGTTDSKSPWDDETARTEKVPMVEAEAGDGEFEPVDDAFAPPPGDVELRKRQKAPPADHRIGIVTFGVGILIGVAVLALYGLTMLPSIGWGPHASVQADAIELRLGGAADDHPLYVVAGHATTLSGWMTDRARLVTLTSVIASALTVVVVFMASLALLDRAKLGTVRGRVVFAAAGALSLAVAHGFWLRAATPAPAALAALLFAVVVWLWLRRLAGGGRANLILASFLLGLSLTVDIGLVIFVPLFLVSAVWLAWRPQNPHERTAGRGASLGTALSTLLLAFGIGLLPLIALEVTELARAPLAGQMEVAAPRTSRAAATLGHVGREAIDGRLTPMSAPAELDARVGAWGSVHLYNFLLFATVLGLVGGLVLLVRPGAMRAGLLLVLLMGFAIASATFLPVIDLGGAALTSAVIFAMWVAAGSATLLRRSTWITSSALLLLVVATPVLAYFGAARSVERRTTLGRVATLVDVQGTHEPVRALVPWRHGVTEPAQQAAATLAVLPEGAALIVLEESERLAPVLRHFDHEGGRQVVFVEPTPLHERIDLAASIAPAVEAHHGARPIYLHMAGAEDRAEELTLLVPAVVETEVEGLVELTQIDDDALATLISVHGGRRTEPIRAPSAAVDSLTTSMSIPAIDAEATFGEADSLFAATAFWQAAAIYGSVISDTPAVEGDDTVPPEAYARYAVALTQSGMPSMAHHMKRRFVEAAPDEATANATLGRMFFEVGNPVQARGHLEAATRLRGTDHESLYYLGRTCEALGDIEAARQAYQRCLTLGNVEYAREISERLRAIDQEHAGEEGTR